MLNGKLVYTIVQTPQGEFLEYTGFAQANGLYIVDPEPQNQITHIPTEAAKKMGLFEQIYLVANDFVPQPNQITTIEKSIQPIQSIQQNMNYNPSILPAHVAGAKGAQETFRNEVPGSTMTTLTFTLTVRNPAGNGAKKFPIGGTTSLVSYLFGLTAGDISGLEFGGSYGVETYTILQNYILQSGAVRITYWQEEGFNATSGATASDVYGANSLRTGAAVIGQLRGELQSIVYPKSPSDFQLSVKNLGAEVITKLITANSFFLRDIPQDRSLQIVVTLESVKLVEGMVLSSQL